MRVERVSDNQFTIFLTFDDLVERGFSKEELWHDLAGVRKLFSDMMFEASLELGFELEGMLLVQVYMMQAQGMHVTVTQNKHDYDLDEDFIELKVTLDESKELIFSFADVEDVIQLCFRLLSMSLKGGQIFHLDNRYYMLLEEEVLEKHDEETIIAIMSEFAMPSIISSHRLKEYGKVIIPSNAIATIGNIF